MVGRDIPSVIRGGQADYKKLYYSEPTAALKVPVTLQAGYGALAMGTILSQNESAAGGVGKCLPYNPTTFTGVEDHPGRAYLVASSGTTATVLYTTISDSYKFAVGDDVIINSDSVAAENLGAITAIDRTTYPQMAAITVTVATGGSDFTTGDYAYIACEAGDSSNNYSDAVGILEKSVDTGTGADAKGALATLILGNCVVYTGMLVNSDSAALTDLSGSTFGNFTYIR